jgi:putative transposase
VKRVYRLYVEEGLAVRRRKRKRLMREAAAEPRLIRANQEWGMDFIVDGSGERPHGAHPQRGRCIVSV